MAAYFLRFGRLGSLKGLQVNSWVTLKKGPALWFCTQPDEPKRPVKKPKAVGKTGAPHERAALLAHRTAVSFPSRLSEPAGFPLGGTGESVTASPVGEAAPPGAEPFKPLAGECERLAPEDATTASSEPQDTAESSSSSSSSSDSDSDLDSDLEDNQLDGGAKIRNVSGEWADVIPGETKGSDGVQHPGRGSRGRSEESEKFSPETGSGAPADGMEKAAAPLLTEAHKKTPSLQVAQAEAPVQDSAGPAEVSAGPSEDSAGPAEVSAEPIEVSAEPAEVSAGPEEVSAGPSEVSAGPEEVSAGPAEVSAGPAEVSAGPEEVSAEPIEVSAGPEEVSAETQRGAAPGPVTSKIVPPEAESLRSAEDLKEPVLVSAEATEEDLSLESAAEQLEEPAAAAVEPAEPEEPFDNSTYKNCQHHSYTPFTFVDQDVDMAKYRLPQPSSGRPSPRH